MNLRYTSQEKKYFGIDFKYKKIVEAQYTKSSVLSDNGNPFIEGLPLAISKVNLIKRTLKLIADYDYKKISELSDEERCIEVQKLQDIRIPMPYLFQIYRTFIAALRTSYSIRTLFPAELNLTVKNEVEQVKVKSICDYSGDPSNGFTLLGASGCGKSTSIMLMLEQFPQLILHENKVFGRFLQIVYLKVNCLPNSNISALLDNIGAEIDKALRNTQPFYENEVKKCKRIGDKINKVCRLIEIFNIGALILDEIQLLDFDANKEASFESILAISNNTKIAIIAVGTKDAYAKMFPNLRTSRRTGMHIDASSHCSDKVFFDNLLTQIWKYQWFDQRLPAPSEEMRQELYRLSKGIIDQLIKIYIQMHLEYFQYKDRPVVDREYIYNIVCKYYPGTIIHLKNLPSSQSLDEKDAEQVSEKEIQCFNELKHVLSLIDKTYNDDSIMNAIKVASKRKVNADNQQIITAAYNHLSRFPSDARRNKPRKKLNHDEARQKLLDTVEKY